MIRSFSLRYGENTGNRIWYKVEDDGRDICVRVDGCRAEKEFSHYAVVGEDFLETLAEGIIQGGITNWNEFYDIDQCLCSGDSWVLHVFYKDGKEIHAMGHSAHPEDFQRGCKRIDEIFGGVIK